MLSSLGKEEGERGGGREGGRQTDRQRDRQREERQKRERERERERESLAAYHVIFGHYPFSLFVRSFVHVAMEMRLRQTRKKTWSEGKKKGKNFHQIALMQSLLLVPLQWTTQQTNHEQQAINGKQLLHPLYHLPHKEVCISNPPRSLTRIVVLPTTGLLVKTAQTKTKRTNFLSGCPNLATRPNYIRQRLLTKTGSLSTSAKLTTCTNEHIQEDAHTCVYIHMHMHIFIFKARYVRKGRM